MPVMKNNVSVVRVRYICDQCGVGEMMQTGTALLSNPPIYPHICNACGFQDSFRGGVKYPFLEYVDSEATVIMSVS